MRLLIAEDEKDLNRVLVNQLTAAGYTADACFDGEEALDFLRLAEYDAVILDIMMPKLDGLQVLKSMREKRDKTPVLLLTARDGVEDRVKGLDCGADDYLVKPFAFDELAARIRVLMRRSSGQTDNCFTLSDLVVDCDRRSVRRGDTKISLSSREFSILEYMIRNQSIVLSREKIEQHIWNFDYAGGSNVVDVYIRYLRRKIDDPFTPKLIHTVRGAGYVLKVME